MHVGINSSEPMFDKAVAFGSEPDAEPLDNVITSIVTAQSDTGFRVTRDVAGILLGWPDGPKQILEQTDRLGPSAQWRQADGTPFLDQGHWRLTIQPAGQTRFYRLRQQ